jgi:hypothetical protein
VRICKVWVGVRACGVYPGVRRECALKALGEMPARAPLAPCRDVAAARVVTVHGEAVAGCGEVLVSDPGPWGCVHNVV